MLRGMKVDTKYLHSGLDDAYVERLASMVETSSLDRVVLLAQDIPDDSGRTRKGDEPCRRVRNSLRV